MKRSDHKRGLTVKYLKTILDYDPESGIFLWKINVGKAKRGDVAGKLHPHGYILIGIKGYHYLAHRLAWFYIFSRWPNEIDHINLIKNDNRMINLRIATRTQNNLNSRSRKNSTSGYKGASFDYRDGRYDARITIGGITHYLGRFLNPEDANRAYHEAAVKLCGDFARSA